MNSRRITALFGAFCLNVSFWSAPIVAADGAPTPKELKEFYEGCNPVGLAVLGFEGWTKEMRICTKMIDREKQYPSFRKYEDYERLLWMAYGNRALGYELHKHYWKAVPDYTYVIDVNKFKQQEPYAKFTKLSAYKGRARCYSAMVRLYGAKKRDINNAIADWSKVLEFSQASDAPNEVKSVHDEASGQLYWLKGLRAKK